MSEVKEGYGFLKTLGIFVILGTVIYYAAVKDWLNSACQTDYKQIEDNNYFSFNMNFIESRLVNNGDDFERI